MLEPVFYKGSIVNWPEIDAERKARVAGLERLCLRSRSELRSVLADINAEQVPFDGDDFHELLRDLDAALDPLAVQP